MYKRQAQDAQRMLDETGVDAVMVGRAALGNPWVIRQMVAYVEQGIELEDPTYEERIEQCLKHARELIEFEGERLAIKEMRGHAPWYIKGVKSSSYVKNQLSKIATYQQLEDILNDYSHYLSTGDKSIIEKWDKQ